MLKLLIYWSASIESAVSGSSGTVRLVETGSEERLAPRRPFTASSRQRKPSSEKTAKREKRRRRGGKRGKRGPLVLIISRSWGFSCDRRVAPFESPRTAAGCDIFAEFPMKFEISISLEMLQLRAAMFRGICNSETEEFADAM